MKATFIMSCLLAGVIAIQVHVDASKDSKRYP